MKTHFSQRDTNREYYESNLKKLETAYQGKFITITRSRVAFSGNDYKQWEMRWDSLTSDEKSEAYNIYIPGSNESFCGLIGP